MKGARARLILIPDEPINGFCYPYCRLLLDKLLELKKEDRLYSSGPSLIGTTVIRNLHLQIGVQDPDISYSAVNRDENLEEFIAMITEYLAIFEK